MIKLRKIITQLDTAVYEKLETSLVKNRADNFLFLLQSYRSNLHKDDEIADKLQLTSNSFYVLKSRLHDKIQEYLSGDIHASKEEVTKLLHQIPETCYGSSREVATAFLQKLEKELLFYDMHNELLVVYSALKKIHLYSDKYFSYSQLYNKHIAFSLSIEKSAEILGNFNVVLSQYNFSRDPKLLDTLLFLKKGINDHHSLNPSRQIEIIKNIINLQLCIFCDVEHPGNSIEDLLGKTQKMIDELPESSQIKNWITVTDFLYFEYYHRAGQKNLAAGYYEKVNAGLKTLLLYTNISVTSFFLLSRITFLQQEKRLHEMEPFTENDLLYDPNDTHTKVIISIYHAMVSYYKGKIKEAASILNEVLNINSFKDFFHINAEIKLSMSFFYLEQKEYEMAGNILKNLHRKIKSEEMESYVNILHLIKLFNYQIKEPNTRVTQKQKDNFELFLARNKGATKVLDFLTAELRKKYS